MGPFASRLPKMCVMQSRAFASARKMWIYKSMNVYDTYLTDSEHANDAHRCFLGARWVLTERSSYSLKRWVKFTFVWANYARVEYCKCYKTTAKLFAEVMCFMGGRICQGKSWEKCLWPLRGKTIFVVFV